MEDVHFMVEHAKAESYLCMIDSSARNRQVHPEPNQYTIHFNEPFRNVFGVDLVDASIPRTQYTIDNDTDTLYFASGEFLMPNHASNNYVAVCPSTDQLQTVRLTHGDYKIDQLAENLTALLCSCAASSSANIAPITVTTSTVPYSIQNKLRFTSPLPFAFVMDSRSTMRDALGFGSPPQDPGGVTYTVSNGKYSSPPRNPGCTTSSIFASVPLQGGSHLIEAPGPVNLTGGARYVLVRCPEVETHMHRQRASEPWHAGLGMVTLGVKGYGEQRMDFVSFPPRTFHPVGRLGSLTIRLEKQGGLLYDTRGVDHTLLLVIKYYSALHRGAGGFDTRQLNPAYQPDTQRYLAEVAWKPRDDEDGIRLHSAQK
jgi:hypothetical protein